MLGTDFLLHAGILYPIYTQDHPFLLDNTLAFYLIPIGYASFLISAGLIYWLVWQLQFETGGEAGRFSLVFGTTMWGSLILGLFSIANAPFWLLIGWFIGQSVEIAIAGYVMGTKLDNYLTSEHHAINRNVLIYVIICLISGIIIQNLYINL